MQVFTVKNDQGQSFQVDEDKVKDAEKDGYLPVVSDGSQEHRVEYKDLPLAAKDGFSPLRSASEAASEDTSKKINSIVRGGVQGLTRGTSDEIAGGVDTALDYGQRALNAIGLADKSSGQVNEELKQQGFKGSVGPSTAKEVYTSGRDDERMLNKQAEKDSPALYTAGNLGGSLLGKLSPAGMIADAAVQGAGYSEADNMKDLGKDIAQSTAIGVGTQGLAKGGGAIAEYLGSKFGAVSPSAAVAKLAKDNAGIVGAVAGGVSHGPAGAVTGYLASKEVVPRVIDKLEPLINKFDEGFQYTMKNLPPKYKAVMDAAGTRGGQSQAIQHFLLGQRDPEYQQLIKDSSEQK